MAWQFLWRVGVAREVREQVFHLVRWHQRPFHLTFAPTLERDAVTFSQLGRWRELLALAAADNLGRIAPNIGETAASLKLLCGAVAELGVLDGPWPFHSDAARVAFARTEGRSRFFDPPAPRGSHVVVMCGLPGAGKDTRCRREFPDRPQVSLDRLRETLDVAPADDQGQVVQSALAEARGHLRAKRRFVWNATNVSRLNREKTIGLCLDYDAFVEIHAFDPPPDRLFAQNRGPRQRGSPRRDRAHGREVGAAQHPRGAPPALGPLSCTNRGARRRHLHHGGGERQANEFEARVAKITPGHGPPATVPAAPPACSLRP